jgi:hypothetical protein
MQVHNQEILPEPLEGTIVIILHSFRIHICIISHATGGFAQGPTLELTGNLTSDKAGEGWARGDAEW